MPIEWTNSTRNMTLMKQSHPIQVNRNSRMDTTLSRYVDECWKYTDSIHFGTSSILAFIRCRLIYSSLPCYADCLKSPGFFCSGKVRLQFWLEDSASTISFIKYSRLSRRRSSGSCAIWPHAKSSMPISLSWPFSSYSGFGWHWHWPSAHFASPMELRAETGLHLLSP